VTDRYQKVDDLPGILPLFPLRGVILLPRATLPLNVFEPRYLALVDDALGDQRLVGIVQPAPGLGEAESPSGKAFPLREIGCVGRITAFSESDDGRLLISLTGVARFRLDSEMSTLEPYRRFGVDYRQFSTDLKRGWGDIDVDRERLLAALRAYLDAHKLEADWRMIERSSSERLINTLAMSPYGPEEEQALLEAPDLRRRAETLIALAEMELAAPEDGSGTALQ
jgi:Lon protease-like protein